MSFSEDMYFDDFEETNPFSPAPELGLEQSTSISPKKSGRKKKAIWDHFEVIGVYKSGHTGAKCIFCLKEYKNAKPTDLEDHIATQCTKVSTNIKAEYLRIVMQRMRGPNNDNSTQSNTQSTTTAITASTSTSNKRRRTQSSVTSFYEPSSIDSAKEIHCTRALTKFFVCCGIPFSLVEHPFFLDYSKSLCPGYEPPGRNFLSTTLINTELAYVQVAIEEDLANENNLTLVIGIKAHHQRLVYETALEIWKNMGGGKISSENLIGQMQSYSKYKKPWDIKYIEGTHTINTWWTCATLKDNFIQIMALKITSLTSHNVSCERIFSILGWFCNKRRMKLNIDRLEAMSKLHSYYVTNAQAELKCVLNNQVDENQIENIIHNIQYNENDEFEEIEEDEETNETNETDEENNSINNSDDEIDYNDYFNFSSEEFCKAMEMNISVIIEPEPEIMHGDLNFNNNELLNDLLI
ncbi:22609_t:CDS:2 [Dentiscutata erythropus]|uniref:22609_t:CDS:1 n=1 Tax=Dentiscutata erythropus TaxID=1348616 RepID=A0A9N9NYE8_9GLOM|nr:22609_t:CDS:2 [Dentiscutata erythropus]